MTGTYTGLETFFTASEQLRLFGLSCLLGIPIGIAFDCFRALRLLIPHNRVLVALEDMLFLGLYGVFLMCFVMSMSRGELRWFYPVGNGLGFVVYHCTAGVVVVGVLRRLLGGVRRLFAPLGRFLALICAKMKRLFVGTLQKIKKK